MAMFPCPDCKKIISENAERCPKCGRVINPDDVKKWQEDSKKSKEKGKKLGIIMGLFIIIITVIGVFIPKNKTVPINQVLSKIESTMDDFKDVNVYISSEDDHIICVDVTIDGTANGIAALKLIGTSGNWESWDKLTDSFNNLSKIAKQSINEMGHKEMHVLYNIKNDKNADNIFYSSLDGTEVYNVKND